MQIFFRVDASAEMGVGHVARCLTLAQGLADRGAKCHFVSRQMTPSMSRRIQDSGHSFSLLASAETTQGSAESPYHRWLGTTEDRDAEDTLSITGDHAEWAIVDHYALSARWEAKVAERVRKVMAIDDLANREHRCDLLLDQNFYSNSHVRYAGKTAPHTRMILGPEFALLRGDFANLRKNVQPRTGAVRNLLVFFGGVDQDDWTSVLLRALRKVNHSIARVDVVIGAEHPQRHDIERLCTGSGYILHAQTDAMAQLMAQADLAIGAGGTATWERCCLGVPSMVFSVADNQRQVVNDTARAGILYAPTIGRDDEAGMARHVQVLLENPHLLCAYSRKSMELVDGLGVPRVLRAMSVLSVRVRAAAPSDSTDVLAWRNEASVRHASRNSEQIDVQTHARWFADVLKNPQRQLLIGESVSGTVGVVRFDIEKSTAEVSIYMTPNSAGQGFGSELLLAAEDWLRTHRSDVVQINAEVLDENVASHRLFGGAGYARAVTRYTKRLLQ